MSSASWSRLAAPFPAAKLAWHAVARAADGTRLRLAPHLPAAVLRARLDEVVGPADWSLRLRPWGEDGLIGELTVQGATRSGAVRVAAGVAPEANEAAAAAAFGAAAAGFGMVVPVALADDGWVDADPETGEFLHLPDTAAREGAAAGQGTDPADGARGAVGDEATTTDAGAGAPPAAAGVPGPAEPRETEAKPEAQRVIDRLMERLRSEGLGAEAARLVTSYGGYGSDPQANRELYARLRALLIERSGRT